MTWKKGLVIRAFSTSADLLGGTEFLTSIDEYARIFARAREAGFHGVQLYLEIDGGILNLKSTEGTLRDIGRAASNEGVELPSLEIAPLQYSLTSDDAQQREDGVRIVTRALTIARSLGCRGALVIPGYVGKMWDPATDQVCYADAYRRTFEGLKTLALAAESLGVSMDIEPIWNMFLLSPLEIRDLVDDVGSGMCGVLLDTGNVTAFGFAEQWLRILGGRVREIHMKDYRRQVGTIHGFVPLLAGDVNWPDVVSAALETRFSGYWIAEQFPYRHHGDAILNHTSDAMDRILAAGPLAAPVASRN